MSLPGSLGSPETEAAQLLRESFALSDPLGVPVLVIHPEDFEQYRDDPATLRERVTEHVNGFFNEVSGGDEEKTRTLSEIFTQRFKYIQDSTAEAAKDPSYSDAHAASLSGPDGEPVCGIIVAPRAGKSFAEFAAMMAGVDKSYFAGVPVTGEESQLMSCWHEFSHCAGAKLEPQADEMAAIIYRKTHADTKLLETYADARAVDAVLSWNTFMRDGTTPRNDVYGWAPVKAIDGVARMSEGEIAEYNESRIRNTRNKSFDFETGNVRAVGEALAAANPAAMESKNLAALAVTARDLLAAGTFGGRMDPRNRIASRFLLALDRITAGAALSIEKAARERRKAAEGPAAEGPAAQQPE